MTWEGLQGSVRRAHALDDLDKAKAAILADLREVQAKKSTTTRAAAKEATGETPQAAASRPDQELKEVLDYALQVVLAEVCVRCLPPTVLAT